MFTITHRCVEITKFITHLRQHTPSAPSHADRNQNKPHRSKLIYKFVLKLVILTAVTGTGRNIYILKHQAYICLITPQQNHAFDLTHGVTHRTHKPHAF